MAPSGSTPGEPVPTASVEPLPTSSGSSETLSDRSVTETSDSVRKRAPLARTRWVAATIALAVWLTIVLVSAFTSHLQVCHDEVSRVGTKALVQSCGPISVTDAPSLALLVTFAALLIPDLSALEIPGIFRVERKLEEQAKRQDDIAAAIHRLEVRVSQSVGVEVNNYNVTSARSVRV